LNAEFLFLFWVRLNFFLGRANMAYATAGAGPNLPDDLSSACTVSSGQCVVPYPYDVDVSSIATRTTNNNPVVRSFGGVRQFLCRTLKQVHFSGTKRHPNHFYPPLPKVNCYSIRELASAMPPLA
jgi:hypothetical protein